MSKIIIENRTKLTDTEALFAVLRVVSKGRISNNGKQYCYGSRITFNPKSKCMVYTELNKKSDRFIITNDEKA